MQIGRDYVREVDNYNKTGGVAAIAVANTQPIVQEDIKKARATEVNTSSTAEEMLHFWYKKADAETKARFKTYINQQ